jgi:group II intron reverse transcriptase/maturase
MKTALRAIANKAANKKSYRFQDLYRMLNEENLTWAFYQLRKDAASGVDNVTFHDYESDLEKNIVSLVYRLRKKRYRAKLVRRKNIKKPNGKLRPLGIPALEDKIVQLAVASILCAIFEQDFLDSSYGYRKGMSAHQALEDLREGLQMGKYHWIAEADIRGFFDNMDHDWLVKMIELRVDDKATIGLIKKWLKIGVLEEDGNVSRPEAGSPQGGIISPVLSNIYLHFALDLWFENVVAKNCRGDARIIRFADDFVCLFEYKHEAFGFEPILKERLGKFSLEVAEEKTQVLMFSWKGGRHNGTFDFLGFEFRRGRNKRGISVVQRRTSRKKLQRAIVDLSQWIKAHRCLPTRALITKVKQKLQGHAAYYGMSGNSASLNTFYYGLNKRLFKWLNRRSQRKSLTWKAYNRLIERHGIKCPKARPRGVVQLELELDYVKFW